MYRYYEVVMRSSKKHRQKYFKLVYLTRGAASEDHSLASGDFQGDVVGLLVKPHVDAD
jgi:hypothetical protein